MSDDELNYILEYAKNVRDKNCVQINDSNRCIAQVCTDITCMITNDVDNIDYTSMKFLFIMLFSMLEDLRLSLANMENKAQIVYGWVTENISKIDNIDEN